MAAVLASAAAVLVLAVALWPTSDALPVDSAASVARGAGGVLQGPIVVAGFENETDDPSLDLVGRLAADWVTEGLIHTQAMSVVPWQNSVEAGATIEAARLGGQSVDPVTALAAATGARSVVTGSFYRIGDELRFRAEVIDARDGSVVSAPQAVSAPIDSVEQAITALRDRLMGSIAIATDTRLASATGLARLPPTFEAYKAFDRGLALYLRQQYTDAVPELVHAYELDPGFHDAALLLVTNLDNIGTHEGRVRADSLLAALEPLRSSLTGFQDLRWQYLRARLDSDGSAALQAALRAAEITGVSRTAYNAAHAAVSVRKPRLAIRLLTEMDPDSDPLRGWAHYWTVLAHAYHLVGDFESELESARSMRERFPDRTIAAVLEARALAADGRVGEIETVLTELDAMSPSYYWSQGAALVVAGEELRAHGYEEDGIAMLERGRDWMRARLRETPGVREHRYWLGSAYYDLEQWEEAAEVFAGLTADFPEWTTYRGLHALGLARTGNPEAAEALLDSGFEYDLGDRTALLARIAAIRGDAARGVSLLSVAFQQGLDGAPWLHASAHPDLELMRSDPRFDAVLHGEVD